MSFSAYSLTASANVSINGVNIAEQCPAANVNDAIRQLMADGKELATTVASINVSSYMPLAGGAFSGNITRDTAGGFWYHANSAQAAAPVYTQIASAALPSSPVEGTVVLQYS
jgi:hypothetical protein